METDRLNPVTLVTGAAYGMGAMCARALSSRSTGGLILVDADEAALSAVADKLERRGVTPERLSTLAFDVTDEDRWTQAGAFIKAQYGRLDWAIVSADPPQAPASDLVQWGRKLPQDLNGAFFSLRAVMPLMHLNMSGGAIIVTGGASALPTETRTADFNLLQLVRAAALEGAHDNIRINLVAPGETAAWAHVPRFNDLVRESGSERIAFDTLSQMPTPMARYSGEEDVIRLIGMLLSDDSPMTGAALIVDGGDPL